MKIYDQFRDDVEALLMTRFVTPVRASRLVPCLVPKWITISNENIIDTLRAAGFPVIGENLYRLDE